MGAAADAQRVRDHSVERDSGRRGAPFRLHDVLDMFRMICYNAGEAFARECGCPGLLEIVNRNGSGSCRRTAVLGPFQTAVTRPREAKAMTAMATVTFATFTPPVRAQWQLGTLRTLPMRAGRMASANPATFTCQLHNNRDRRLQP